MAQKLVGYTAGSLAGWACVAAGGSLICVPVAYGAKMAGKAIGGWLWDQTGLANEWGPLNTVDWPTLPFDWPLLLGTAARIGGKC